MRIISGTLGGREIKTVAGKGMRPAMGRTREALFSMLEARGLIWDGVRVLDLFAGSGSLGIECISRGAERATFVEASADVCEGLAATSRALGINEKCRIVQNDALKFLRSEAPAAFDIAFVDPPYRQNLANQALKSLATEWLSPRGFLVAELEPDAVAPDLAEMEKLVARSFGQTSLHIWRKNENSAIPGNV